MTSLHSWARAHDSPLEGADDTPLEVVAVDTRSWGEQGGSYSPDRRYRWRYERPIGSGPPICWIGLNPGTGDREGRYRPTLQRMVDRSVQLGMGRFILVNLFSWRTTDPRDLRAAATAGHDIIGSDTDQVIADAARPAAVVVAACGHHGTLLGREGQVLDTIPDLKCVGLTAKGHPRHPLYVQPPNHSSHCTNPTHPATGSGRSAGANWASLIPGARYVPFSSAFWLPAQLQGS